MADNPRRSKFSVDGFVPNSGRRQVGFGEHRRVDPATLRQARKRPPGRPAASVTAPVPQQPVPGVHRSARPITAAPVASEARHGLNTGRRRYGEAGRADPAEPTGKTNFWKRHNWKKILKRSSAVLGVLLLLWGGYLGYKLFNTSGKVFGDSNLIDFLSASKLEGEDEGRTNILLAGVSSDDPGHGGADLTDSIMVVSLDTKNRKAFMLSIPRDLWVNIPGYGYSKINAANVYGDQDSFSEPGYPAGGIGLLEKTLSTRLDLPIHYHVKMNYSAMRDAVNAVGGVDVTIDSDDNRGLYDPNISAADKGPLRLPNGKQTLDGQTALNLARARGDPPGDGRMPYGYAQSDFTRTKHQRLLLVALKDKVASPGVIANPLKLGQLFDALGDNVKTDFKPSEVKRLFDLSKLIASNNIRSLSLNDADGENLLASYVSADGASALIPAAGINDFSVIQRFLNKQLSSDETAKESPEVVVLNGGETTGLATQEGNFLTARGMTVLSVGDAPTPQARTVIIDQSKGSKPASRKKLTDLYGNNVTTSGPAGYENADFVIVLGNNQKPHTGAASGE